MLSDIIHFDVFCTYMGKHVLSVLYVAAWAKQSKLSLLAEPLFTLDCTCAAPSSNCEDRGEILSGKHATTNAILYIINKVCMQCNFSFYPF